MYSPIHLDKDLPLLASRRWVVRLSTGCPSLPAKRRLSRICFALDSSKACRVMLIAGCEMLLDGGVLEG